MPGRCEGHDRSAGERGPDSDWEKLFFDPREGRPINTHVRVAGKPNERYALLFRDTLRAHPRMAEANSRLKRRLAAVGIDRGAYADTKDPACDLIIIPAEEWAARTGWKLG